jgi:antitoxin ParD1/3/4
MPSKSALSISLTPALTSFIAEKCASGRYRSASEVVRVALRLVEQHEPATTRSTPPRAESRRNGS